ncbi:DNA primase [Candidatus Saganbacteria bacterium]|nr:DNA primase [Candidatus Saganbacteria bacterium]
MIAKELIEQIRNKADIVAVVSEYVALRKRGKNYLGLCPFHSEKTASFTVSPDKQIFHCFGCHEGGNVFAFLMKIENIGFADSVAEIGDKIGIAVSKTAGSKETKSERERLHQVMDLAAKFFQQELKQDEGAAAWQYLRDRQIPPQTTEVFRLGFAPAAWDSLCQHLISRGVAPALLEKTGLGLRREGSSGYYDRFRNRLIIPIADQRGRIIAFGGRSLGNEEPKYLNSPETTIYHKGEALFGLNLTRESVKKQQTAILVEGYFDLIMPYQNGFTNMAATLGTALTSQQIQLLARLCDTIILSFDSDAAGGAAAERSINLLREAGLKVRIAALAGGKDPDEIIRRLGKEAFAACLTDALPYLEFKIKRILARHNIQDIESKAKALQEIADVLTSEEDQFVLQEYCQLAAKLLFTSQETVLAEVKRQQHYQFSRQANLRRVIEKPGSKQLKAEKTLLGLASQDNQVIARIKENLTLDDFQLPQGRAIAELLFSTDFRQNANLTINGNPAHFLLDNLPDDAARNFLSQLLVKEEALSPDKNADIVGDCLSVLRQDRRERRITGLKAALQGAEQAGNKTLAQELLNSLKSEIS